MRVPYRLVVSSLGNSKWRSLKGGCTIALAALALTFCTTACTVGRQHTPDSDLERTFQLHKVDFEALLAKVVDDKALEMIRADTVRYGGTFYEWTNLTSMHAGFTKEDWQGYNRQMHKLGIVQINKAGSVDFRVDAGSVFNGDSYKGYEYSVDSSGMHLRDRLDDYRSASEDRDKHGNILIYKRLQKNWYLYLFVNG